jgi:hypothetical protein
MKTNDEALDFTEEERQRALEIIARYRDEPKQLGLFGPQGHEDFLVQEISNAR